MENSQVYNRVKSKVRDEGEKRLGLESREGEDGGRVDVSGFCEGGVAGLRRDSSLCDCSSSLITALLEDKAGHAQWSPGTLKDLHIQM